LWRQYILIAILVVTSFMVTRVMADSITVCQCNIFDGGRWTGQNQKAVTYDTVKRFAQFVASVNPPGSKYPPIAVIGMQEVLNETDCEQIKKNLKTYTKIDWNGIRTAQGINNHSGVAIFWRPDLVEHVPEWYLGTTTLGQLDNGYIINFVGRLFRKVGTDSAFGFFTGKLVWEDAFLKGVKATDEYRSQQAIHLKNWIKDGEPDSPGMSMYPGTVRVIATDMNSSLNTSTWKEMNLDYSDPGKQCTHNSYLGTAALDLLGKRLDYIWWSYDSSGKHPGGFQYGSTRSKHFGSDHRALYATIELHPVDLTPPIVTITSPLNATSVNGIIRISIVGFDASGIQQVQININGVPVWTGKTTPFDVDWDTANLPTGYYTVTATATDASTNKLKGHSQPVVVWVGAPNTYPTITYAKQRADGELVFLSEKTVTESTDKYFYISEPDNSNKIRVTYSTIPAVGAKVNVVGRIMLYNGEREIAANEVVELTQQTVPEATLP